MYSMNHGPDPCWKQARYKFKKAKEFTRVVHEIFNSTKMNEHLQNAKGKAKTVSTYLLEPS